jgi:hypothetical protein
MSLLPNGGSWVLEDGPNNVFRTQNTLIVSDDLINLAEVFITDPYLPVQFTYPFAGTYFRPAEVQIAKGTVVAHRAGSPYTKDYDVDFMRPALTIANGGNNVTVATPYGNYQRLANKPIGIAFKNCYKRLNDRFKGNYPTITRASYITLPYFAGNTALAQSMKWGACYDGSAGTLNMGDSVMSDANGKIVKWDGVSIEQRIGKALVIDRNVPVQGWLQWVMWEWASSAGLGQGQNEMFNPYDLNAPLVTPDGAAGDTTTGTSGSNTPGRPDLNAVQNQYPAFYPFNDLVTRFPEQLFDAMGIPGLTDGARMAAVDYTESVGNGTQNVFNGTTGTNQITLNHKRVAKDQQGATNPTPDHPFPTKMLVYNNADTSTPLVELVDYTVDRYRGIVYISKPGQSGTETYTVTYTSLENQVVGVPSNIDFKGSVGAVRIFVDIA